MKQNTLSEQNTLSGATYNVPVDWDAYDEAYAAAPSALPTEYLTPPVNCTFGGVVCVFL